MGLLRAPKLSRHHTDIGVRKIVLRGGKGQFTTNFFISIVYFSIFSDQTRGLPGTKKHDFLNILFPEKNMSLVWWDLGLARWPGERRTISLSYNLGVDFPFSNTEHQDYYHLF